MTIIDHRATDERPTTEQHQHHHPHVPHVPAPWARLDGRTAAGIAFGAAGLFMFNIICGPFAIGLGITGHRRATSHLGRTAAVVSVVLGILDLVLLGALVATKVHGGTFDWQLSRWG